MTSAIVVASSWVVLHLVVVVESSSGVIWSQDHLNGCCGSCSISNECKTTHGLEKSPIKCAYVQLDKRSINFSKTISNTCGKPDKLKMKFYLWNDTMVLNVTWGFPKDKTIAMVMGFLIIVQYESPSVSGEIVNFFSINGSHNLGEEDLIKLTEMEFVYDCVKVLAKTNYTVTVQTMPSIERFATERASLSAIDIEEKFIANCSSRWVAMMFVKIGCPVTGVCFKPAPQDLQINKYVLHVMTERQYKDLDPPTFEHLEKIDLSNQQMSGTYVCRNFTLNVPGNYVAKLQPDVFCKCFGEEEPCHHTFVNFVVPLGK